MTFPCASVAKGTSRGTTPVKRAVSNLPGIILGTIGRHAFGIMIARGNLAVKLGGARLAEIREEILWLCEAVHVPAIRATQGLETLAIRGM